jgi:hypothetical protein
MRCVDHQCQLTVLDASAFAFDLQPDFEPKAWHSQSILRDASR